MTDNRSPPAPAEACLCQPYPSRQKGGTVIAEDVVDFAEHERRLRNGGYRPARCARCGEPMHIHDYRPRVLPGDPHGGTSVAIFRCSDRDQCGAVMRVLPMFVARRLWRTWPTVEQAVERVNVGEPSRQARGDPVAPRTVRRWCTRLRYSAAALVVTLATAADTVGLLAAVVRAVGLAGTRRELVVEYAGRVVPTPMMGLRLGTLAAVVHRLERGVRLM